MDMAEVVKSGETCLQIGVERANGLVISVRALQRVEEFVKSLGTGEVQDVSTIGRHWTAMPKDSVLRVYDILPEHRAHVIRLDDFAFSLDRPGQPLVDIGGGSNLRGPSPAPEFDAPWGLGDSPRPRELLNLSFLRLAGISEPSGVMFKVNGVYTKEQAAHLTRQIEKACQRFYIEYIKPYKVIVSVMTMPLTP